MVTYGFPDIDLEAELALANWMGVEVLEILPQWSRFPDPRLVRERAAAQGLSISSAHGCWGSRTIRAQRVDLGATDPPAQRASVDDLRRCIDWLVEAGGSYLVVHPGGLSDPAERTARRAALARGLLDLAKHAAGTSVQVCVENMPPGVHPGSRMAELAELLAELNQPGLALVLDTGHAHLTASLEEQTFAAESLLATTHVHDNNGHLDSHEPPGRGTIDWTAWGHTLDSINYAGPIMLECIRYLRQDPSSYQPDVLHSLARLAGTPASGPDRL
jgi:sugar phosphate isomerase/epimerase